MSTRRARSQQLSERRDRGIWLAITLLASTVIGSAAGLLAWSGGAHPADAILTGAAALGGAILLGLTLVQFMSE